MWLPKDERRLLQGYYLKLKQAGKELRIEKIEDWVPIMKTLHVKRFVHQFKTSSHTVTKQPSLLSLTDTDKGKILKELREKVPEFFEINLVNMALKERKLINTKGDIDSTSPPRSISLTTSGCDLGRKYNCWLKRSGLWFAEYKDHWFWLVLSFLGGIIGALLVNWLSK